MPVYAAAAGSANSDTTVWVQPPAGVLWEGPNLQILVGPSVQRSLLDIVLGATPSCLWEIGPVASGPDWSTSDLMASLALQKLLHGSREAGGPEAQALDARIRTDVSLFVSSQNDNDGGWSWTGGSAGATATPRRGSFGPWPAGRRATWCPTRASTGLWITCATRLHRPTRATVRRRRSCCTP